MLGSTAETVGWLISLDDQQKINWQFSAVLSHRKLNIFALLLGTFKDINFYYYYYIWRFIDQENYLQINH